MYKRILIPLDGSALAEQALPHAIAQAQRFEAELVLLRVLAPLPSPPLLGEVARSRAKASSNVLAREYLERVVASVQEHDIPVQVATAQGSPPLAIHRVCRSKRGGSDRDVHTRAIGPEPLVDGQRGRSRGARSHGPGSVGAQPEGRDVESEFVRDRGANV